MISKNTQKKQQLGDRELSEQIAVEQKGSGNEPSSWGPERFPLLRGHLTDPARFDAALQEVVTGVEAGAIRNAVLQDVKFVLGRVAEAGWKKHVNEPYIYAGKWEALPQAVRDLSDSIMIMSLHDVIATSKKVARSKATGPAVDAMRMFCLEALPLAEAVASLKDKVIKGRAPRSEPAKPVNPNKVVKTCPVCFRQIAVQRGTMAHHGFERPGYGSQTASCYGIRFKPLEVSSEGLEWLISWLQGRLERARNALDNRATQPEFLLVKRSYNGPMESVTRSDPAWKEAFRRHVAELRGEIHSLERELPRLEKILADWAPEQA